MHEVVAGFSHSIPFTLQSENEPSGTNNVALSDSQSLLSTGLFVSV